MNTTNEFYDDHLTNITRVKHSSDLIFFVIVGLLLFLLLLKQNRISVLR